MPRESFSITLRRWQGGMIKKITGYRSLKSFIRELRSCKSISQEKAFISKELLSIHSSLRIDGQSISPSIYVDYRWQSIAKLLFCALYAPELICNTAFAQIELLSMCSNGSRLRDRRIGYLSVSILLDTAQHTQALITNTIKRFALFYNLEILNDHPLSN